MKHISYIAVLCVVTVLSCCVPPRDVADKKLEAACKETIRSMYNANHTFEWRNIEFTKAKGSEQENLRIVKIFADHLYNGTVEEVEYICSYHEKWVGLTVATSFYSLRYQDQLYGVIDGRMRGDMRDLMRINDITDDHVN